MSDITVSVNGYQVNLRVGAIVFQDTHILVCRMKDKNWWFLPGSTASATVESNAGPVRYLRRRLL